MADSKSVPGNKMESKSKVHENFKNQSMIGKGVEALPGIGPKLSKQLISAGYVKAEKVLGMFLLCERDCDKFKDELSHHCNPNAEQLRDCFEGLKDWCLSHL